MISSCVVPISSSASSAAPLVRPVLSFLFGSPVLSSRSAFRASACSPPCRSLRPARLVLSSSCRLVRLSLSIIILSWLVPFTAAGASNEDGGVAVSFFFSCAVFVSSLSFAHIIGFSSSGASDRPVPRRGGFVVSSPSSHPAHLTRPHCPRVHHGGGGVCHLSSKQRHHGGLSPRLIISSHHGDDRRRWRGASRPGVSSYASRSSSRLIPGHQRGGEWGGADEASKRTQKNGRKRDEKPGEKRNENGKTTRSEAETKTDGRSKQAGRDNEGMRQSRTRTKTPIIIFARPPHHRLSSVRRPQMFPRPPGRGMSG